MSYSYGKSIVTDGLVFYVDAANENSYPGTGTTWSDLIGGNDGTLTNGPTFDSANGGSIVLDGVDDHIQVDIAATTDSSFTYNFWFNTKDMNGAGNQNILGFNRGNGGYGTWVQHNSTQWKFTIGLVAGYTINDTISTNTIYNACWVVDGNSWKMYVDGSLVGTKTISSTRTDSGQEEMIMGCVTEGDGTVRSGTHSNHSTYSVAYYDRALSASEVLQNYNALKNRFI